MPAIGMNSTSIQDLLDVFPKRSVERDQGAMKAIYRTVRCFEVYRFV